MYYNSHIHIFKLEDVPAKFLPLQLVRFLAKNRNARFLGKLLNRLNPFSDNDFFSRYARFIETGKLKSQEKIFEGCNKYYPDDTKFVVLPMDMAYMKAGKVPRDYKLQIEELGELAKKDERVIPFFAVDPRREGVFELLTESVEKWNIKGVKIYTPLGYFPFDERLFPIYEYCVEKGLPVISHCSPYNKVHYRGSKEEIMELITEGFRKEQERCKKYTYTIINEGMGKKYLCANFANPENYRPVLDKYPKLKICLAHFGSERYWTEFLEKPKQEGNWFKIIRQMIQSYNNLYTDVSFTMNNKGLYSLLKVVLADQKWRERILFGSDYYMVETEATERRFGIDVRASVGEEYFQTIAKINPERFLNQ